MTAEHSIDALQLDLATIVARLEQVQDQGGWDLACPTVKDRILTCDLPRLRGHLTPEASALIANAGPAAPPGSTD